MHAGPVNSDYAHFRALCGNVTVRHTECQVGAANGHQPNSFVQHGLWPHVALHKVYMSSAMVTCFWLVGGNAESPTRSRHNFGGLSHSEIFAAHHLEEQLVKRCHRTEWTKQEDRTVTATDLPASRRITADVHLRVAF